MSHPNSTAPVTGRPGRTWTRVDTRRLARLLGVVGALHVVGWGALLLLAPAGGAGAGVLGLGLGVTAYAFGVRHAFDVDHIAVIDGATRKLTADGQRPLSVGFWFSLGHSSVVFVLALLLATGARFATSLVQDGSTVHDVLATFGTGAAGVDEEEGGRGRQAGRAEAHPQAGLSGVRNAALARALRGRARGRSASRRSPAR